MASSKRNRVPSPPPSPGEGGNPPTPTAKVVHLSSPSSQPHVITCSLPHPLLNQPVSFPSYSAYEEHYASSHTNRCLSPSCGRNFPTTHFLSLHIAENHDPLQAVRREKGEKTYACFVEGCDKLCRDWKKRRSHLVDKHAFPREYDFLVVDNGVEGRSSLLRTPGRGGRGRGRARGRVRGRGRSGSASTLGRTEGTEGSVMSVDDEGDEEESENDEANDSDEGDEGKSKAPATPTHKRRASAVPITSPIKSSPASATTDEANVAALTQSMSALRFVPPSVRFGRGGARGGLARQ